MKKIRLTLKHKSMFLFGLFAFLLVSFYHSALADELFPELGRNSEFRSRVEQALDNQENVFTFESEGKTQKFYVSYGRGYLLTHAVRLNTFKTSLSTILRAHKLAQEGNRHLLQTVIENERQLQQQEGSQFLKFLSEKAIYEEDSSSTDQSKKFSVYIRKPGSQTHESHPAELATETHDDKLGPYFSFSLTLMKDTHHESLPLEYLDPETHVVRDVYRQQIAHLIFRLAGEKIKTCPRLSAVQNTLDHARYDRDNTPGLSPEEMEQFEMTFRFLHSTEQMLFDTEIIPLLTTEAKISYVRRFHPEFPEELILAVIEDLNL